MMYKEQNKKLLIALLLAILIHILLIILLYFHKQIRSEKIFNTPVVFKDDAALPVSYEEDPQTISSLANQQDPNQQLAQQIEEANKALQKALPISKEDLFDALGPAELIPGASSKETIIDGQDFVEKKQEEFTETSQDSNDPDSQDTQDSQTEDLQQLWDEQTPPEQTLPEQVSSEPTLSQTKLNNLIIEDEETIIKKMATLTKVSKTKKRAKLPIIANRRYSDAPVLKNVIEGFTAYMNEQGNNAHIERTGVKGGKIDLTEAMLLSYYNRVLEFFQNTSSDMPDYLTKSINSYFNKTGAPKLQVDVKLIILSNGTLEKISIIKSSGIQEYDNFIINKFKQAAPYRPIPKHLNKEKIIFPIGIYVPLSTRSSIIRFL